MNFSFLVGTRTGIRAQRGRELWILAKLALRSPQQLSYYANDMIAGMLIERLCRRGGTFVDVGAHIGSVIAGVRQHGDASNIIAVEAVPTKAAALRKKFPTTIVHCCAVGDADGQCRSSSISIAPGTRPCSRPARPRAASRKSSFQSVDWTR